MAYAIKYYRDAETVRRYQANGIHNKPPGLFLGTARYDQREKAQRDADHINSFSPRIPVIVVQVSR